MSSGRLLVFKLGLGGPLAGALKEAVSLGDLFDQYLERKSKAGTLSNDITVEAHEFLQEIKYDDERTTIDL
jgi:hypothetical protein